VARTIWFINRFFYPDHSATSQLLADLALSLARRGHRVRVVTSRQRYDEPQARLPAREEVAGVRIHRVWTSRFGRSFLPGRAIDYLTFYLSCGWCLLRLVRPGDLVVAKTDPPLISVVAGWMAALRRARLVNWLQDLFPEVAEALGVAPRPRFVAALLRRLRDDSLLGARMNVAIGEGMRRRLLTRGVPEARVAVIHNWSDEERVRPLPAGSNALRRDWGLADKFVVGYSGNLGRAHGYETLLAAAQGLRQRDDVVFLFIGGGAAMQGLEAEAAALGLRNLVFRPYQPVERLAAGLAVADVHLVVLRPEMEGLIVPSKFYGIAAAGRPAIFVGSPDGEIARLLAAGEAGIAVAQGDGAGLASAVLRLREDPELLARSGRNARALCEERFSRLAALDRWEQVLVAAMT